ncbi:MAG: xylulose kinase [bacterium]|nr:xylulose kinase [bacterium]
MANTYLAGIDIGTTGAKAIIFDLQGNIIASGYREYTCVYPKPNWVEQDAPLIVSSAMEASQEAISKAEVDSKEIASIAFSTQRSCTIFIDRADNLVRPMISWQDQRAVAELERIREQISPSDYYQITGMPLNTTWLLSKILWLRNNEPENWERVHKVVQLQDYTLKSFGAEEYVNDIPDAGFSGIWNPYEHAWSTKLLEMFAIDRTMLPKMTPSGTQVGTVSKGVAEKTGFAEGTPVCVGAGDQNSAVTGAGIINPGYLSVSLGTGGIVAAYLDEAFHDPSEMNMFTNHTICGKWQLEGYQAGAAGVYRWFRDEIATLEKAYAGETKKDVYQVLNELVANTPPGAKGLVFLPYLASATTPRWNPNARGTLVGLTFAHDRGCLARAFMEGITLEIKDILNSMYNADLDITHVRILGGPTKSPLWNQMQADIYNRPVDTLKIPDASVLGAAICAGVGVGLFKDIREGVSQMVAVDRTYEPKPENAKIYDELYEIYCRMYEGLDEKGVFQALAKFQERV